MLFTPSKLPTVNESIFSKMTQLANKHQAINLSQGFPDFATDTTLIKMVNSAMQKGYNQYAPLAGIYELRAHIAEKTAHFHKADYDVENEITITSGASEAIFSAITTFVHAGDEVIIFDPSYELYAPCIQLIGATVRAFELDESNNFEINWELFKKLFNSKTKMIIVNTPHNPTGKIFTQNDINQLIKITSNTDVILISDEVYGHIIYDHNKHLSFSMFPELKNRSIITVSFGKLAHATGWKIGYCLAPQNLMKEFRKIHQFNVFCVNTPMQYALAKYFDNFQKYTELGLFFQEKRDYMRKLLLDTPFRLLDCEGTYFQCIDFSHLSNEKDTNFAKLLTEKYGVATIPLSVFYTKNKDAKILRLCFAKEKTTIEQAVERLHKFKI